MEGNIKSHFSKSKVQSARKNWFRKPQIQPVNGFSTGQRDEWACVSGKLLIIRMEEKERKEGGGGSRSVTYWQAPPG